MTMWGVGGTMVIFLAGLQDVPAHLYEAARAGWRRAASICLRHVTIPMVSP